MSQRHSYFQEEQWNSRSTPSSSQISDILLYDPSLCRQLISALCIHKLRTSPSDLVPFSRWHFSTMLYLGFSFYTVTLFVNKSPWLLNSLTGIAVPTVHDMRHMYDTIQGWHHWHYANGGLAAVASYFCFFAARLVFITGKAMTFSVDQVWFLSRHVIEPEIKTPRTVAMLM